MPDSKDLRLYARFDIAMDEHPKVMLLSDAAFRALIEATFYARRQMTDGFLDDRVALRKWGSDVVGELASNHDERPSFEAVDGGWQIRDYAEHQTTRADIEAKREAGRKGGLAKAKQAASTSVAGARDSQDSASSKGLAEGVANVYESLAKTETETELERRSKDLSVVDAHLFDEFWSLWPRKEGKAAAVKAWAKATAKIDPLDLLERVGVYTQHRNRPAVEFVPHASTWLNGERWNDGPPVARSSTVKPSQSDRFHDTLRMGRELQAEIDQAAIEGAEMKRIA